MTCITAIRVSWTILYAFDFHYPYLISEATAVVRFPVTCMALGGARTGRCVSSSLIGQNRKQCTSKLSVVVQIPYTLLDTVRCNKCVSYEGDRLVQRFLLLVNIIRLLVAYLSVYLAQRKGADWVQLYCILCCVAYKSRTTNLGLSVGKSTLLYSHTVMAIGLFLLHVYCTEAQGSHPSSLRKNNLLKAGFLDYFHLL